MLQKYAGVFGALGLVFTVACAQTDAGITTNVKTKLAADTTVKAYQIDVDTQNHVVTLKGDVETSVAKEQALRIARETDGVRDVIDQIHVKEAAATGGLLDRTYEDAKQEGREAADKAREVGRDVSETVSGAAKKTGNAITDAAITTTVKSKFLADPSVKGLRIDVDTSNGVVTLTGTTSSRSEAERAIILARNTDGVVRVIDNLHEPAQ
jgi:osmotically-inducible protein OsmY